MRCSELLRENLVSARDVAGYLKLTAAEEEKLSQILTLYPMSITPYYLSLIDWEDPDDPVRKMCIPSIEEFDLSGSFDTSGEADNTVIVGMQHKYRETALILSTNRCAMYCRHCFRKRLVGLSDAEIARHLDEMFDYLREHREVTNVLISGGDAFMNDNHVIQTYLENLCAIDHLDFIRFGSRVPVTLPARITEDKEFLEMMEHYGRKKQLYLVTHFNHPHEITPESIRAIRLLMEAGLVIRNQTVLLKGINSEPEVLGQLLKQLTGMGAVPYYVFQCRPVTGVKNQFQVSLRNGYRITQEARNMQNGMGKSFRYAMSHDTGKIEILGDLQDGRMLFKYHQAKYQKDAGRIFTMPVSDDQCWLPRTESLDNSREP